MRSSEPCSGSPQVCPGVLRTLDWTRWDWSSWGWGAQWPCKWPMKPQFDPARAFMMFCSGSLLNAITCMRAEGEVGVQRDTQDFRGSLQWCHQVANRHLRVEPGLVGVRGEHCHAGFRESNDYLFPICPPHQRRTELDRSSLHDSRSRGQQHEVVSIGQKSCLNWKWGNPTQKLKQAGEVKDPCGSPPSFVRKLTRWLRLFAPPSMPADDMLQSRCKSTDS